MTVNTQLSVNVKSQSRDLLHEENHGWVVCGVGQAGRFVGYDRLDGLWGMTGWVVCEVLQAGWFVRYDRLGGLWGMTGWVVCGV